MGILRSEDMGLYWLNMPRESAYDIISALGRMSKSYLYIYQNKRSHTKFLVIIF